MPSDTLEVAEVRSRIPGIRDHHADVVAHDVGAVDPQLSVTTGRFTVEILEFQQRGDNYADRRERKYDEVDYRQRETLD
jgi:hypothetical protein